EYVINATSLGTIGGIILCYKEELELEYLEVTNGKCEELHRAEGEEVQDSISSNVEPHCRYGGRRGHGVGPQAPGWRPPSHEVPQPTG
ncbi:hypothetical protein ACLOJK_024141, partial [Asimina triloba]